MILKISSYVTEPQHPTPASGGRCGRTRRKRLDSGARAINKKPVTRVGDIL
jgi:hypothetical protein